MDVSENEPYSIWHVKFVQSIRLRGNSEEVIAAVVTSDQHRRGLYLVTVSSVFESSLELKDIDHTEIRNSHPEKIASPSHGYEVL